MVFVSPILLHVKPLHGLRRAILPLMAFVLALVLVLKDAEAQEADLSALVRSGFLDNFDHHGEWEQIVGSGFIVLACTNCEKSQRVVFTSTAHEGTHTYLTLPDRYVWQRQAYCKRLVTSQSGRCIATKQITARWLRGFRSQSHETNGGYRTETVLFYGGHILKANVTSGGGFGFADQMDAVLTRALLRMTPVW